MFSPNSSLDLSHAINYFITVYSVDMNLGGGQRPCWTQFSSFIVFVPGTALRSSGLATSTFTCWAISLALILPFCKFRSEVCPVSMFKLWYSWIDLLFFFYFSSLLSRGLNLWLLDQKASFYTFLFCYFSCLVLLTILSGCSRCPSSSLPAEGAQTEQLLCSCPWELEVSVRRGGLLQISTGCVDRVWHPPCCTWWLHPTDLHS